MTKTRYLIALSLAAVIPLLLCGARRASADAVADETTAISYTPRKGQEAEMERLIRLQWDTLVRLHMVTNDTRIFYRDEDRGKVIFVEIMTWKGKGHPTDAPAEVVKLWTQMQAIADKAGNGLPAIMIRKVKRLETPADVAHPTEAQCGKAVDRQAELLDKTNETRDLASQIKAQRADLVKKCVAGGRAEDVDCVLAAPTGLELLKCHDPTGGVGPVAQPPR
jgi:hypothetical protein